MTERIPARCDIRLVIHVPIIESHPALYSMAVLRWAGRVPNALTMRTGSLDLPTDVPSEREAWEALLAVCDWHGSASRY